MSYYSEDDFTDADRAHIRSTRGRLSSPGGSNGAVAPHVPRVIRTAATGGAPASSRGYSPKLSVDMAVAHSWASYTAVVSTLRSLSLLSPEGEECATAREAVARLYGHPTPFGAARRFPAGEVYVCLDRPPMVLKMRGIQEPLVKAEAARYRDGEKIVSACSSYMYGVGDALDEVTRSDDDRGAPALYDRAIFESAFLLTWTEP